MPASSASFRRGSAMSKPWTVSWVARRVAMGSPMAPRPRTVTCVVAGHGVLR